VFPSAFLAWRELCHVLPWALHCQALRGLSSYKTGEKFVKLSSPYNLTDARIAIAGNAGIGLGDLPNRPKCWAREGEEGALELKEERREEEDFSIGGGGNIIDVVVVVDGVLATEVAGVRGALVVVLVYRDDDDDGPPPPPSSANRSLTVVPTLSVSLAALSLLNNLGLSLSLSLSLLLVEV
jgi:hypothetical protein